MLRRLLPVLLCVALPAWGQEEARFASFTLENDIFSGQDRHYTNGLQLAFVTPLRKLPAGIRELAPFKWSAGAEVVLAVGQRIYTPANTELAVPDPGDRPYAGWLYALADVQTARGPTVDHVTVTVGVVGPASLARRTQEVSHRSLRSGESRGWSAQLRNEPTVSIGFERAWIGDARPAFGRLRHDVAARAGVTLGNVLTYANAAAVWRIGTALPDDFPATFISLGPPRDGFRGAGAQRGWYAWAGAEGRAIARNIFLDGNSFRDGPGVKRRPLGHDLQLGIAGVWPDYRLSFTYVERGREFEGQRSPDRFGQVAGSMPA